MASAGLTDEQVFGKGYVYGPGAPESGQAPSAPQQDYARAAATLTDRGAALGSPQNPSYDTPTLRGDETIFHVTPQGQLAGPPQDPNLKGMSDAEVFGTGWHPGQVIDGRPESDALGFGVGVNTVGKNVLDALGGKLPALPGLPRLPGAMDLVTLPLQIGEHQVQSRLDQQEKSFRPSARGKFGGELAASAPFAFDGPPMLMGALQGALTSEGKNPADRLADIGIGAFGGKLADVGLGAAKNIVLPTVRPEAQAALDQGMRLTPGGIAGGWLKGLEGAASKGTIAGPMIGGAQRRAVEDFNIATARNALAPAGLTLPEGVQAGHDAVNAATNALGGAYDALTPHLRLVPDGELAGALNEARDAAKQLPRTYAGRVRAFAGQIAPKGADPLGGDRLQELISDLRREAADAQQSGDFFAKGYGRTIDQLRADVESALERSNPDQAERLRALNTGYAQLVRIQRAARDAAQEGGVYMPKGLLSAVRATDQSARDNATARGTALLQDWAAANKSVLPDKLPTAGSVWQHLPELGVALGVGSEAHMPGLAAMLATEGGLGGLYTKGAQDALRTLMTKRPAGAAPVAKAIEFTRPLLSWAGATGATNVLPSVTSMMLPYLPQATTPQ